MEIGKRKKRLLLVAILGIFFTMSLSAQNSVRGSVKDELGDAIIGATVMLKGTNIGTVTDIEGNYSVDNIEDRPGITLVFSSLGFHTVEMSYTGQGVIDIIMKEDSQMLDEVVVIGYGSLSRKELSSSIVQVNKRDFQQGAVNNAFEMIAGKVAGLSVVNTATANPNAGSDLQIRGASSINGGYAPLVIIDGIVGGNISSLSPQDIESMTVLKDAASTAIYGTRGADGVILITTKKGASEPGSHYFTYDSWLGVNLAKGKPDIMSPDEFRRSLRSTDYGASTDWYDELLRDFSYTNNQYLAVDGSTKNGTYGASINYKKGTGLDIANERQEYGARLSLNQRGLNDRFEFNTTANVRKVEEKRGEDGMFDTALNMNPTMPIYNADGSFYQPTSPTDAKNPVSQLMLNTNEGDRMFFLGTVEGKVYLLKGDKHNLSTSLSYSMHYDDLKEGYFTPSNSSESYWMGRNRALNQYKKWWANQTEWLVNYSLDLKDHQIKVVGGYSYREDHYESLGNENMGFEKDNMLWHNMGAGSYLSKGEASMWSGKTLGKLIGTFARVNYNWKNTIMAAASIRFDGATKFGTDNQWGSFPSASLAWEIANMNFMEDATFVNSLKPRVSYGVSGRSNIAPNQSMSTYNTSGQYFIDGVWVIGYAPARNPNPNLGWEKLKSLNVGVDFSFWNRLRGSIDLFDRQSESLIYTYTAPQPPFIHKEITVNVGTIENRGVEIALNGDIVKQKDITWTSGVNFSYGKTKLKTMSDEFYKAAYYEMYLKPGVGTNEYFFRTEEGSEVGHFYGYEHAGVTEDGYLLVYNKNNEKVLISSAKALEDKRKIGKGTPDFFLSWDNTFRYKDFDLNIFCRGAFGFDIFNMRRYGMGLIGSGTENVLREAYTKYAAVSNDGGGAISSFFLEKGDYFKIENVTLGYSVPLSSRKYIDRCRLSLTAKNLYTFTKYSGNDPSIVPVNGIEPGVDISSAYPLATQLSLGLTITFK